MKLSNISLATKLWMALGCVIVLLLFTLIAATGRSQSLVIQQEAISTTHVAKVSEITRWAGLVEANIVRVSASVVGTDPAVDEFFKERIPAAIQVISDSQKKIEGFDLSPESKALFARIGDERTVVRASTDKIRDLKAAGDQAGAAHEVESVFNPAVAKYGASLQEMAQLQVKEYDAVKAEFAAQRQSGANFARILVAVLVVLLAIGTWLLIEQIRKPLQDAIVVAETIASGDLSAHIAVDRGDEFGQMMRAIAHMQERLVHLVGDVRNGTVSMSHVSEEIAAGNNDLSARTEQTAANLEETASSMQELTSTVKQSADSARQANQLAGSAAQVAKRGGEVVGQVVSTMDEINASSRKISDIISVIDGIAFQTNILALNAAVEAARAGEQGRGFAVVASEVRSLAGRSADAAKEIKMLINTSVEKVEGGSALVAQAGQTMTEIVTSVQRVTDIMGEITAAASEQSDGIAQVNSAIAQLDQMTQQNAALVEQSAAAASSMKDQAHRLAGVVATFKLDGMAVAAAPVHPPATSSTLPRPSARKALAPAPAPRKVLAAAPKAQPAFASKVPQVSHATAAPPAVKKSSAPAARATGDDDWEAF